MIELRNVRIRSGPFQLNDLELCVPAGGYGVLMGSTGSGKTTLLEAICGLRNVAVGRVLLDGVDVTRWSAGSRGIGYVPQDAALFPTLSVRDHLAFGLELRRRPRREISRRVEEVAAALGISGLLGRSPRHLSGGEARRVAIGRAIAFRPRLLLLDEPLSALDEDHRLRLIDLLTAIHQAEQVTTLHVTHYSDEAAAVGEHFFRLVDGRIAACDHPTGSGAEASPDADVSEDSDQEGARQSHEL